MKGKKEFIIGQCLHCGQSVKILKEDNKKSYNIICNMCGVSSTRKNLKEEPNSK
jgi:transcription elongation factor Elf1